jgi:hypothetical protein
MAGGPAETKQRSKRSTVVATWPLHNGRAAAAFHSLAPDRVRAQRDRSTGRGRTTGRRQQPVPGPPTTAGERREFRRLRPPTCAADGFAHAKALWPAVLAAASSGPIYGEFGAGFKRIAGNAWKVSRIVTDDHRKANRPAWSALSHSRLFNELRPIPWLCAWPRSSAELSWEAQVDRRDLTLLPSCRFNTRRQPSC